MAQQARTFRVFVSSTFSDLKTENKTLQKSVFLKLREGYTPHGAQFQTTSVGECVVWVRIKEENGMTETYDWSRFYDSLCRHGPNLLLGIDDELREMIEALASSTDMFWSDGLQERLAEAAANDDLRADVLAALELWRENVLQTIDADFGIELDWQTVSIDAASPLIDELVEAASPR